MSCEFNKNKHGTYKQNMMNVWDTSINKIKVATNKHIMHNLHMLPYRLNFNLLCFLFIFIAS